MLCLTMWDLYQLLCTVLATSILFWCCDNYWLCGNYLLKQILCQQSFILWICEPLHFNHSEINQSSIAGYST